MHVVVAIPSLNGGHSLHEWNNLENGCSHDLNNFDEIAHGCYCNEWFEQPIRLFPQMTQNLRAIFPIRLWSAPDNCSNFKVWSIQVGEKLWKIEEQQCDRETKLFRDEIARNHHSWARVILLPVDLSFNSVPSHSNKKVILTKRHILLQFSIKTTIH